MLLLKLGSVFVYDNENSTVVKQCKILYVLADDSIHCSNT